jgi:hypothetical protein
MAAGQNASGGVIEMGDRRGGQYGLWVTRVPIALSGWGVDLTRVKERRGGAFGGADRHDDSASA